MELKLILNHINICYLLKNIIVLAFNLFLLELTFINILMFNLDLILSFFNFFFDFRSASCTQLRLSTIKTMLITFCVAIPYG